MFTIEQWFNSDRDEAFILLAETPQDDKSVAERYNLKYPEFVEQIEAGSDTWEKKVYVYGDSGEGMIYFAPQGKSDNV